ncbi:MAG: DUF4097 family beta strand repeat-containing protein [Lachnospiraceae bacterium]|nr:DUF4097 family beta strand repeat-containing protein [Lachnospiraceae bacterium]
MKKFAIVTLLVAVVLFAIGGFFGFAGLFVGGVTYGNNSEGMSAVIKDMDAGFRKFSDKLGKVTFTRNGVIFTEGKNDITYSENGGVYDASEVSSLDFEFSAGKFEIVTAKTDRITVSVDGYVKYNFGLSSGGMLFIRPAGDSVFNIGLADNYSKIKVTIPEGFRAEDATVSLNAGNLKVDELSADKIELNLNAGNFEINKGIFADDLKISASLGSMFVYVADVEKASVNINAGSFVAGVTDKLKSAEINVSTGSADITSAGSKKDFSYEITSGLGIVKVDGKRGKTDENSGARGEFRVNCNLGSVSINFD